MSPQQMYSTAHWYRWLVCTIKIVTKSSLLSLVVASTQVSQLSLISSNNFGITATKFSFLVMSLALTSLHALVTHPRWVHCRVRMEVTYHFGTFLLARAWHMMQG